MEQKLNYNDNRASASGVNAHATDMPMPKHMSFPEIPSNSELLNELILFLFMACAAAMQFINIYRTVWWLPEFYVNNVVNFNRMEPYAITLILLMASRRFIYCLLLCALEFTPSSKNQRLRQTLKCTYSILLLVLISYCIIRLYWRHAYVTLFLLLYPFVVYLLIFGIKLEPFLSGTCETEGVYFNGLPLHCCTCNPAAIREEVEILKNDFNNRFRQVIFTSVINAYYAGFVPCFFAVSMHYNVLWTTQHILAIWYSCFMLSTVFLLPSKYSDILHRSALHLGHWQRLDQSTGHTGEGNSNGSANGAALNASISGWNKISLWKNGSIVKYSGENFRSSGPITVALPGNSSHSRFYKFFHNPADIYMMMSTLQAAFLAFQLLLFYFVTEWHFILSLSFITLTNQFTFFKILRDYLITKRLYTDETSMNKNQF